MEWIKHVPPGVDTSSIRNISPRIVSDVCASQHSNAFTVPVPFSMLWKEDVRLANWNGDARRDNPIKFLSYSIPNRAFEFQFHRFRWEHRAAANKQTERTKIYIVCVFLSDIFMTQSIWIMCLLAGNRVPHKWTVAWWTQRIHLLEIALLPFRLVSH